MTRLTHRGTLTRRAITTLTGALCTALLAAPALATSTGTTPDPTSPDAAAAEGQLLLVPFMEIREVPGDISKYWHSVNPVRALPRHGAEPTHEHHYLLDQGVGIRRRGRLAIGKSDDYRRRIPYEKGQ